MKPFANLPGVFYPADDSPEAKIDRSVVYVPASRPKLQLRSTPGRRHIKVDGRNVSAQWLNRNGLCIRVIDGVRTVVPK